MPNLFAGIAETPTETPSTPYFFLCTQNAEKPDEVVLGTVEACVVVWPERVVLSGKSPALRELLGQSLAQVVQLPGAARGMSAQALYLRQWAASGPDEAACVARKLSLLQAAIVFRTLGDQALTDKVIVQVSDWRRATEQDREMYIERLSFTLGFVDAFEAGRDGAEPFHVWFYKDRLHVEPDVEHPHVN